MVKHKPAIQETQVQSLGGKDPLEKEMATHCGKNLQYSWVENSINRGAWRAIDNEVPKSQTKLRTTSLISVSWVWSSSSLGIEREMETSLTNVIVSCCYCCSVFQSCPTLCDPTDFTTPGLPVPHHLLKFAQVHVHASVMPSSHLILWHPLLLLPSIFPSIRDFSNELAISTRRSKYCSFSSSPSKEYSGLISLMIDWFDLLAIQGTSQEASPAPQF